MDMPKDRHPRLKSCSGFDRGRDEIADSAEPIESERVLLLFNGLEPGWRCHALSHNNDGVLDSLAVAAAQRPDDLFDVVFVLGDDDGVGTAGDPRVGRDPALRSSHDLDDDDPVVGFRRRGEAVDCLGRNADRRVKTERDVGPADVVVDGLRHSNDGKALFRELQRRTECPVAPDHDQAVDAVGLDRSLTRRVSITVDVGVHSGRSEDGPAAGEDAAHRITVQRHGQTVHQAFPAVPDAEHFGVVFVGARHHPSNHCIQTGAIAARCQDSNNTHRSYSWKWEIPA